jgi:heme-degrading monooxygenase HmoA
MSTVSIHKFAVRGLDRDGLADELAAFARDNASTLPGLQRVMVLSEYGGRDVAVVAEWETQEAWAAGTEKLYADPRLTELSAGTGRGSTELYTSVAVADRAP